MRLLDDDGTLVDAEVEIESTHVGADVVLHSRAGNKGAERNPDYNAALQLVLERMRRGGATLTRVVVDSRPARARYTVDDRTIELPYPVELQRENDLRDLRVKITEGQRLVASEVDPATRGGNKHKRIRLSFALRHLGANAEQLLDTADGPPEAVVGEDADVLGRSYYDDPVDPRLSPSGLYGRDDEKLERALAEHATLQRDLADRLRRSGIEPRKRARGEPDYDIAWEADGRVVVGEVKSLTSDGMDRQLRIGIGQVLQYRELLQRRFDRRVDAVLALSRNPGGLWLAVCERVGIVVTWPPDWPGV